MADNFFPSGGARILLVMAAFVIVVAGMRAAQPILVPFLLSGFFAIILSQPFTYFVNRGMPDWLAMLLVALGLGFLQLIGWSIAATAAVTFSSELPLYQARLKEVMDELIGLVALLGVDVPDAYFQNYFNSAELLKTAGTMLAGVGNLLSSAFLILLTVIFMLFEAPGFRHKLQAAFAHNRQMAATSAYLTRFVDDLQRYMVIKAGISLLTAIVIVIWLFILGVDYAILWGMVAFLFNFVPNIGSIIAAIPAVLMALLQPDLGWGTVAATAAGYLLVNTLIGNFLEPRIMGRGLGLSTLVVFLSLVFWGWVLGPVGMLLSVPLTMTLKIAFEASPQTYWIAVLLGNDQLQNEESAGDETKQKGL